MNSKISKTMKAYFIFYVVSNLYVLALFCLLIPGFSPFDQTQIDAEIVNGVLTASAILFALQFVFMEARAKEETVEFLTFSLFLNLVWLSCIAFDYVYSSFGIGYLSRSTLFITYQGFHINWSSIIFLFFRRVLTRSWKESKNEQKDSRCARAKC